MSDYKVDKKDASWMYLLVAVVVIVAIVLIFNVATSKPKSKKTDNTTISEGQHEIHRCEKCGSTSCRAVMGTIFPDNNVHYLCNSCIDKMS